jgi:hypothetical protein
MLLFIPDVDENRPANGTFSFQNPEKMDSIGRETHFRLPLYGESRAVRAGIRLAGLLEKVVTS